MASEEDVAEILIAEVHARPALWNSKLNSFKNKHTRDKMYQEIAMILGVSKDVVASRWKNKKDKYRRELKKVPPSRSGDAPIHYKSSWPYFEMMSFIKDQMIPSAKHGNLPNVEENENINEELEDRDCENTSDVDGQSESRAESRAESQVADILSSEDNSSRASATSSIRRASRKRLCDSRDDKFLELEKKELELASKSVMENNKEPESEDLYFFKSLIPYMEKFNPIKKLEKRNKIQQIILDELSRAQENSAMLSSDEGQHRYQPPSNNATITYFQSEPPFSPSIHTFNYN